VFVDARTVPDGTRLEADVAIAGAGAAGISLAHELAGTGITAVLLESGGFTREPETYDLNVGATDGLPYPTLDTCRSRFFAGSTNCWGGGCRPMTSEDFEPRAWLQGSGWPISEDDLAPYYRRASRALGLGEVDYDAVSWDRRIGNPRAGVLPLQSNRLSNEIRQYSPLGRFGELGRSTLETATNIRCLLHANLVGIETDASATVVEAVRVATLSGRQFRVRPRILVLAMGGIENARILLLPNPGAPQGMGNAYDLVGRYFMDHPSFRSGLFTKAPSAPSLDLYDSTYSYHSPEYASDGVSVAMSLSLARPVQEEEELLRSEMFLYTTFAGEDNPGREALRRFVGRTPGARRSTRQDLATFIRYAPQVATGIVARRLDRLARKTHLFTIVEPEPNPESRVTLTEERDPLGLNRARLNVLLTPRVERTLGRAQQILADELQQMGAGSLDFDGDRQLDWCCHHMGTTRMSLDARHGVVNTDSRLHDVQNLYVAGSSVFPTAGSDVPTYTIVALAIRLADHLKTRLEASQVRLTGATSSVSTGQADS
jgi:choline dehydrogenase-like flavoprotein